MSVYVQKPKPIKIGIDDILLFIETFLVVKPAFLSTVFDDGLNLTLIVLLLLEVILLKKTTKPSTLIVLVTVSVIYHLGITLSFHSMGFQSAVMKSVPCFLCIIMVWRRIKANNYGTIHVIAIAFWSLIMLNSFSIVMFPDGLTQGYSVSLQFHRSFFLGVDNQFGKILFPALAIIWFDEEYRNSKSHFASITAMAMVLFTYLSRMSGGGLVSTVLFLIIFEIYKVKNSKLLSYKTMLIILALMYVGALGGSAFIYSNRLFADITSLLGKNTTMTGRTTIWAVCLKTLIQHPIFGIGWHLRDAVVALSVPYSAHNRILQTLLEGGIIGGSLLILQIVTSMKKCSEITERIPSVKILSIGIFTTFTYFLVETGTLVPFYILVAIIAMISTVETNKANLI